MENIISDKRRATSQTKYESRTGLIKKKVPKQPTKELQYTEINWNSVWQYDVSILLLSPLDFMFIMYCIYTMRYNIVSIYIR